MPVEKGQEGLLYLLQIANSAFPTGAFNHSYGFETLIDRGEISDAKGLEELCSNWLLYGVAPLDGAAVATAHRAALAGDLEQIVELDNLVGALKLPREIRESSYKMGHAFLTTVMKVFHHGGMLEPYAKAVKEGKCEGHQAVASGVAGAAAGITEAEIVLVSLQATLGNLIGVAARLIPLGQIEAQRIITNSWPLLTQAVEIARSLKPEEFGSTAAMLDIAAMHHERMYSRLCMS